MDTTRYPTSLAELATWRVTNRTTAEEARRRFVQFVILAAIASAADLVPRLALKGGNALRFIHGNRRSTIDLDFSADDGFPDDESEIRSLLDSALDLARQQHQVKARCQSIRRKPPGPAGTMPTYAVKICFQLPGDKHYQNFEEKPRFPEVVDLEISLNDVPCETIERTLSPTTRPLRVCSLEDILAEKLRALLQQTIRNRHRPQDVYDIASRLRDLGPTLDLDKLARFLLRKSEARGISPKKHLFNEKTRDLAMKYYDQEIQAQSTDFIPFPEAWAEVAALVSQLDIPD